MKCTVSLSGVTRPARAVANLNTPVFTRTAPTPVDERTRA